MLIIFAIDIIKKIIDGSISTNVIRFILLFCLESHFNNNQIKEINAVIKCRKINGKKYKKLKPALWGAYPLMTPNHSARKRLSNKATANEPTETMESIRLFLSDFVII